MPTAITNNKITSAQCTAFVFINDKLHHLHTQLSFLVMCTAMFAH